MYRLFMQWKNKGRIHVRLLYEGNQTSCEVNGRLPIPHRLYVSVVIVKPVQKFQAGTMYSHPTKKVVIPLSEEIPTKPGKHYSL